MSANNDREVSELCQKLHQEYRLLHLVYHRNKNQHHVAVWWKRFNMLKRNCGSVLELHLQDRGNKSKIRYIKLYHLLHSMIKKQLSKTYYEFNGIIALGQFVTLGVVLIGLLSRIYCLYIKLYRIFEETFKSLGLIAPKNGSRKQEMNRTEKILESMVQEEVGEEVIIEETIIEPRQNEEMEFQSNKKKSKKKEKKKKKKSAIDSIFG
ncbi:hypothetical protein NCAS_0C03120 [Naumovozyma castellii]|uniref:RNase MRP protein 1 RNA binding domain-containing protein n=1 Tax=Naumovozyma castellii TaxID=27288 RepID=G0VCU2_NAUCA|nr:hypothetical protein NCAS_0C03120 [Naumovozyma castellii CBS 4309]CCC69302.1 hypothetical protein NCAS_0C03120 [Naumovozyma castellii CBS 4309]